MSAFDLPAPAKSWSLFGSRVPVITQAEAAECGIACLGMVAGYHGKNIDLRSLRLRLGTSMRGTTLSNLMRMASGLKLASRALRLDVAGLSKLRTPCILHWNMDHFVVLEGVSGKFCRIIDPAIGRRSVPLAEVNKSFTGIALELTPTDGFQPVEEKSQLTIAPFLGSVEGLFSSFAKLVALSVAIQFVALLAPFYTQLVVDQVIASRDYDLLVVLAVAFTCLAIVGTAISAIRSIAILKLGATMQFGWGTKLFHHMVNLPLSFFERRSVSDVLSRFKSLGTVQSLASTVIVEGLIDGFMAISTMVVMCFYSARLALVSVAALGLYLLLRFCFLRKQKENAQAALISSAREEGYFLETVRGILAIKTFSREDIRTATWQNRAAESIQIRVMTSAFGLTEQLGSSLLFALENIVVLFVGARLALSGELTSGMLLAFIAYKTLFTTRAVALVDKLIEFNLTSVHFDRIADIALAQPEGERTDSSLVSPEIRGEIELRGVHFSYSATDPDVLVDQNIKIVQGECLAISAPSGAGKTTLLKVMMGLLKPTKGEVRLDGLDINRSNLASRRQIAAVMQDDLLMAGTLADNICFFEPEADISRIEECAKLAAIHEDIVKMPMSYHTLAGDMGAALSGGQRQRILLARALYQNPKILFLDEATSHLDVETESRIHASLAGMKITRVMISHRPETLAIADRVIDLGEQGLGVQRA